MSDEIRVTRRSIPFDPLYSLHSLESELIVASKRYFLPSPERDAWMAEHPNFTFPNPSKGSTMRVTIEHVTTGYRAVALFGGHESLAVTSPFIHAKQSDAILGLSRDVDKILVQLHTILHDAADEYLRNKWDELNGMR